MSCCPVSSSTTSPARRSPTSMMIACSRPSASRTGSSITSDRASAPAASTSSRSISTSRPCSAARRRHRAPPSRARASAAPRTLVADARQQRANDGQRERQPQRDGRALPRLGLDVHRAAQRAHARVHRVDARRRGPRDPVTSPAVVNPAGRAAAAARRRSASSTAGVHERRRAAPSPAPARDRCRGRRRSRGSRPLRDRARRQR